MKNLHITNVQAISYSESSSIFRIARGSSPVWIKCSGGHSVTVTVIAGMIYSVGHTGHKKWAFVSICCEDGHGPKLSSVICVAEHDCDCPDCENFGRAEVSVRDLSQVWYRLEPISQFGHLNDTGLVLRVVCSGRSEVRKRYAIRPRGLCGYFSGTCVLKASIKQILDK